MSMEFKNSMSFTALGLLGIAALFLVINMVSSLVFKSMRVDLTGDRLYTLTQGTRNILGSIDESIALRLFYSDKVSEDLPQLRIYAMRVKELLQEYVSLSKGKLTLDFIDPLPYSEQEDQATALGLQGVPIRESGEKVYFGLAVSNAVGEIETIGFFQPQREQFLEYDITRIIHNLSSPEKPVIGVYSTLPVFGGFDGRTSQMATEWAVITQLRQLFQLIQLDLTSGRVTEDIDLLMLVHPKNLSEDALYSIDQYVMRGGRAIIFVDPHSKIDSPEQQAGSPLEMEGSRSSDLRKLFNAWGIVYDPGKVVLDRKHALTVTGADQIQARHYALLAIGDEGLSREDVTSSELGLVSVGVAGHISAREDASIRLTPIVRSSRDAALIDAARFHFLPDVGQLSSNFEPANTSYTVIGRVQGVLKSAFPTGRTDEDPGNRPDDKIHAPHRTSTKGEANLIVVADTDTLSDSMWVQVQDFFGQRIFNAWTDNSALYANMLDNLTGSSDLISIRGREVFMRPFVKVDELRQAADLKFRATEQTLQDKLKETEAKLLALQQQRDDINALVLSPEQEAEIKKFQQEKISLRKQLRQVRHSLDLDIEQLGAALKFINIGLVPLIISLLALALYVLRGQKRKQGLSR